MGSIKITYFVHGTTTDNEQHKATGWLPGELSELGIEQSKNLKKMIDTDSFDVVFCSDLKRAIDSAELTFGDTNLKIVQDKRIRECNYGNLNGKDSKIVKEDMLKKIKEPFPNGESYMNVENRIREFLNYLVKAYNGKHIAIVAHQAPQLALDVITKRITWEQAINEDWRKTKAWKPGWIYEYSNF